MDMSLTELQAAQAVGDQFLGEPALQESRRLLRIDMGRFGATIVTAQGQAAQRSLP